MLKAIHFLVQSAEFWLKVTQFNAAMSLQKVHNFSKKSALLGSRSFMKSDIFFPISFPNSILLNLSLIPANVFPKAVQYEDMIDHCNYAHNLSSCEI